ncbi:MAG TPA: hypothetical protein VH092_21875, partial [Urbifossiella sp.]|nr:hypothetical protein [Urbifossiella sp.]
MSRQLLSLIVTLLHPGRYRPAKLLAVLTAGAVTLYVMYLTPEKRATRTRLDEADTQAKAAIDVRLRPVRDLFVKGRKGAPAFAEEVLSWRGKWALARGFFNGETHRAFVAEAHARHIFTPDEVRAAIEGACRGYADDLDGVEAQMLVRLRADLQTPSLPADEVPAHLRSNESFATAYRGLAGKVAATAGVDVAVVAGREVVVLAAGEVATRAAVSALRAAAADLGIQTAVLSGGGVSTVVTLGVGIVIAVIIDYAIDKVF